MLSLRELILAKKGAEPYEKMAERAGTSPQLLSKFGRGANNTFPERATVEVLAKALDVSPREVIIAAAVGLGFVMDDDAAGSEFAQQLPAEVDEMPDSVKTGLLATIRAIVREIKESRHAMADAELEMHAEANADAVSPKEFRRARNRA